MELNPISRKAGEFQVNLLRDDNTINRPRPYLALFHVRKLKELNPHLEFKWNGKWGYWEVWFRNTISVPYIIYKVVKGYSQFQPIDERVFADVRHALWFSQNIRQHLYDMQRKRDDALEKRDARTLDNHVQAGKEIAPLVKSLADAGNSSHGRSKFKFPGFGDGVK